MTLIFNLVYTIILIFLRIPDFFFFKLIIINQSNSNSYTKNTLFLHSQKKICRLQIRRFFVYIMDISLN